MADKKSHTLTFTRVASPSTASGGLKTESINSVPDPTGENGSPPAGDVDLTSPSPCTDNYPTEPTFICDVELISGFSRDLANVYVQISDAELNGSSTSLYDGYNSATELDSTNDGTLTVAHGLWLYDNSSVNAAVNAQASNVRGVIGSQASGFNTATVEWDLQNPGDANVVYTIVVYATEFFGNYEFGSNQGDGSYGNMAYTDACSGAAGTLTSGTKATISLPFDFTLFNTDTTSINVCTFGEITTGSTPCVSTLSTPSDLSATPKSTLGSPLFFPFWEKMKFGASTTDQAPADGCTGGAGVCTTPTAGRICWQTLGSAPNRMEVIEWRNMDFTGSPDTGSSMDFEAYLYEGTGEVDLYYENMVDGPSGDGRSQCSGCFIGTQGSDNSGYDNGATTLIGVGALGATGVVAGTALTFHAIP